MKFLMWCKNNTKKLTKYFLAISGLIWIVYDIIVAFNGKEGDTISEITLFYSFKNSFIPFAIGYLIGHLFWPRDEEEIKLPVSILFGIAFGISCFVINRFSAITINPIAFVIAGIVLGHILWFQKSKNVGDK
jgi:hypothetical protein